MKAPVIHIINIPMDENVSVIHGSGGLQAGRFIREIFTERFGIAEPLTDSALIKDPAYTLAFTTDSYVVDPPFFPGGNIGKLAVCGTVNDLAVSGAIPEYISASFIIEEGFPKKDLIKIAESMAEEAEAAGIKIITGDTKVVDRGKCDGIFITTSGIGIVSKAHEEISGAGKVKAGDRLIINGPLGNHSVAVLGARWKLGFSSPVISDCCSLNHLIQDVLNECSEIHFMRDLTRGGLATTLNELAEMTGLGMIINENSVPIEEPVRGLCEMFGFDPLYLANEGKLLIVAGENESGKVIEVLRSMDNGRDSSVIGEVTERNDKLVVLNTVSGGRRIIGMISGNQLPRIC
jgi:hydrogenase expression/formation protein HypE